MSMVKLMRGEPIAGSRDGPHRVGSPNGRVAFRPGSYERKGSLVLASSRSTGMCLGLPSWMYIDCSCRPPWIWIPLVAPLLS